MRGTTLLILGNQDRLLQLYRADPSGSTGQMSAVLPKHSPLMVGSLRNRNHLTTLLATISRPESAYAGRPV